MIIVQLQGGLGNQMFQYACGRALSIKHGQELLIDHSFLQQNQQTTEGFTPRGPSLGIFDLKTKQAPLQLVRSFTHPKFYNKALKLLKFPYKKCYVEDVKQGASQLNNITFPVLLKGYWQSENYFAEQQSTIRKDLSFNTTHHFQRKIAEINQVTSVSIHYRRGDYLTNPVAKNVLGVLNKEYYTAAIARIKEMVPDPFFFIFSDDAEWVEQNLPVTSNYKILKGHHDGESPLRDIFLMSKCKHHIIANSSFSWWGAWLNPDPEKIVIAPRRWFADAQLQQNSQDLIPADWIRL